MIVSFASARSRIDSASLVDTRNHMIFNETPLAGAYLIDLEKHGDERGFFGRVYCEREFAAPG